MPKYLLAYHGGRKPEGEAAAAATMAKWRTRMGEIGPLLVDGGSPVAAARTVHQAGAIDGGWVNPISGYSLVTADDLDAAARLAFGCPIVTEGGSIEVAELQPIG